MSDYISPYISGREKNLKIGISSYTDDDTVLEVTGRVGIGTTNATSSLHVVGNEYVTGVITAKTFYGTFIGATLDAYDTGNIENLNTTTATIDYITNTNLNTIGIGTIETLDATRGIIDYLTITNLSGVAGTITNITGVAATITNLNVTSGIITNLNVTSGTIINIAGTAATITNLNVTSGIITNLTGVDATITNLNITNTSSLGVTTITQLSAQNISNGKF